MLPGARRVTIQRRFLRRRYFCCFMGGVSSIACKDPGDIDAELRRGVLGLEAGEAPSLEAVARRIREGDIRKIVCLCGAGISVSCGIPDFRSEGTGLYHNLQKYDLDRPESIFDIEFFRENPRPFIHLAKELYPGQFSPSVTHHFMKLLENKNKLLRVYTQNIDGLEFEAGLSADKVVQCHGGFQTSHCIDCGAACDNARLKEDIMAGRETRCKECGQLCKPGITFFGEALPRRYHDMRRIDFVRMEKVCCYDDCTDDTAMKPDGSRHFYCEWHLCHSGKKPLPPVAEPPVAEAKAGEIERPQQQQQQEEKAVEEEEEEDEGRITCEADLLIVMGTSLAVAPVSGLADEVHWLCPRVLINREVVHEHGGPRSEWPPQIGPDNGFRFSREDNYRDVACIQDCDEGTRRLAVLLGWEDELDEMIAAATK